MRPTKPPYKERSNREIAEARALQEALEFALDEGLREETRNTLARWFSPEQVEHWRDDIGVPPAIRA
ncbi:MAG: hypothetical protein V2I24_12895, partial [Halieaceae bacterium]|nr:hypothetical protein [Halieaceae bacterium]